jgi:hypothetical protein
MVSIIILTIFILIIIVLLLICFKIKKQEKHKIIILGIIGLLIIFLPIYGIFKTYSLITNEAVFVKKFTQLNQEINIIHNFNKILITGKYIEISGFIKGQGILTINYPNDVIRDNIVFELDGKINIDTLRDWYRPEFELDFKPENEYVEGKIILRIKLN